MRTLILASASPRRHALLARLGLPFQVRTAAVEEHPLPGETPVQTVRRLSRLKAKAVSAGLTDGVEDLIIAADTLVFLDHQVLGKPRDADEAVEMLRRLRRRAHQVVSGITVLDALTGHMVTRTVSTIVWMRDYSEAEMAAYVATGDPLDKAGAYAVQRNDATAQPGGFRPVERVEGCPLNVMGLPLCRLDQMLRRLGVLTHPTPAQHCDPRRHCQLAAEFIP